MGKVLFIDDERQNLRETPVAKRCIFEQREPRTKIGILFALVGLQSRSISSGQHDA